MPSIEVLSSCGTNMEEQRKRIKDHHTVVMLQTKDKFQDVLAELFFLQNGGNMMDFLTWKKKPPAVFMDYVKNHPLELPNNELGDQLPLQSSKLQDIVPKSQPVSSPSVGGSTPIKTVSSSVKTPNLSLPVVRSAGTPGHVGRPPTTVMTPEQIVEKAKQEAYVMQRIAELQREGLWSEKRLPKVAEPSRAKTHWDYLLEEMVWLAGDFSAERKWKKNAAKKCARMVQKYFQDKAAAAAKAEKEEEQRLRKIASFVAKEIRTFWSNVEKLVDYKQKTRLEEKRKKVLDQHLNFIVLETEKYSSWLQEGLTKTVKEATTAEVPEKIHDSDVEFEPNVSSSDDEETIAQEEKLDSASADEVAKAKREKEEIEALQRESEMPLEELLNDLPPGYFESMGKAETPLPEQAEGSDEEFEVDSNESVEDDEETIDQAEKEEELEDGGSNANELQELEAEMDMPLEKLLAKYSGSSSQQVTEDKEEEEEKEEQEDQSIDSEGLTGESDSEMEVDVDLKEGLEIKDSKDLGIESLLEDSLGTGGQSGATSKLSDAAALAESFQPKGNTLESTQVIAKVPFLLKHSLREYQHIGLDWMAAMYERKLNGILADEMGLGKTIQTIALLAWLACEKGIWGPHLVVVPTSVMLNWEMEFKKWCPSFKILTYYGTQKDRRQKRMGWTKPNAFHVCITSYKLVIQDHQAFRRKRWRYFILDEAQNIKNFKSQRWQLLLNFQSQRRLLLTGTPLQNNLMELWSLMHFLMPDIFGSHRDFREWFSNPVTGMIEGNAEYNESIIRRLHKVLRPFILRRLKSEVEKQMPKKYEHIVMCRLSKRQRYLYDDFMSKAKTKETLASGNLLSVINVLMQLRKVCNHPNLFEPRPIVSPFQMESIIYQTASLVYGCLDYNPFEHINLSTLNLMLADLELTLTAFAAHRIRRFQASSQLIEEIDSAPPVPPPCPRGKIRLHVRPSNPQQQSPVTALGRNIPMIRASTPGGAARLGAPQVLSTAGGVASPQQPRLAAPAPSLPSAAVAAATSGAVIRPQVQLQFVQRSGSLHAVSFPNAQGSNQLVQVPSGNSVQSAQGEARSSLSQQIANTVTSVVAKSKNQLDSAAVSDSPSNRAPAARSPLVISTSAATGRPVVVTPQTPVRVSVSAGLQSTQSTVGTSTQCPSSGRTRAVSDGYPSQNGPDHANDNNRRLGKWSWDRTIFKNNAIDDKKRQERRERLSFLAKLNKKRCEACPIYGSDLIEAVTMTVRPIKRHSEGASDLPDEDVAWSGLGRSYVNCLHASLQTPGQRKNYLSLWSETDALKSLLLTPEQRIEEMKELLQRFVICTSAVAAPPIVFHVSHPPPARLWGEQKKEMVLKTELSPPLAILHPVQSGMMTLFPDPRLIQYDCGKLQTLDKLLRELKAAKHRVLIFTQMTRMLDVLEAFLNYHGHIYLRLDGTTRVDQRQVLMERFNADRRIFCFILSTRSGGIGVNLTGADTVIFYDSDWNPTMDAQAQDRCHRIGQTRDVHIYRLISEKTVEENILKKANQKRLLGDIAIEGGNFTAATFKKQTIHDLFEVDLDEADASKRMADVLDRQKAELPSNDAGEPASEILEEGNQGAVDASVPSMNNKAALGFLESALAAAEDETDVAAARTVRAEAAAEMAEFDESAPLGGGEEGENSVVDGEIKKVEAELLGIEDQLTPVERYAMRFMESSEECWSAEQLRAAEAQIEEQKKAWELKRLASLSCNDDGLMDHASQQAAKMSSEPEGGLLTFAHQDSVNQMWVSMDGLETMPMWCPPTPPQDDNDVYLDYTSAYLYETQVMDESRLPPVYIRKELKRVRKESVHVQPDDGRRPAKIRKEETVYAPRSLFDRPSPALAKLRRDIKLQKFRGIVRPPVPLTNLSLKAPPIPVRPIEEAENTPEWLIHEDWILLQAVQNLLELPLNLVILTPAHTPNWDLVADMVNSYSRSYRSPKQCRNRYISVILPREEGKMAVETSPKKIKKTKTLVRPNQPQQPQQQQQQQQQSQLQATSSVSAAKMSSTNRPMRTSQLYIADNNNSFSNVWHQKFDTLKGIFHKKAPTNRSMISATAAGTSSASRSGTNVKHAGVLQEAGIVYDSPLNPVQVAAVRAERIAQKQKTALAEQLQAQQQQQAQQQVQQQQQRAGSVSVASPANGASLTPGSPVATARLTPIPVASPSTATVAVNQAVASSNSSTPATAVVMSSISSTSSGQHTLLLQGSSQANLQTGSSSQQQLILQPASAAGAIRAQRQVATLTMQDAASTSQIRTQQPGQLAASGSPVSQNVAGQTVVTVSNLTAVQVQAATQMLASAGIITGTQLNTITTTAAGSVKGTTVTVVQTTPTSTVTSPATASPKALTPTQLQYFRQQVLVKQHQQQQQQRLQEQQLKKLQLTTGATVAGTSQSTSTAAATTASVQKVPLVAVSTPSVTTTTSTLSNFTSVQIAGATGQTAGTRTQLIKGGTTLIGKGGTAVTRTIVTEAEMAALIKRQQIQQQQKAGGAASAGSNLQGGQQQTTVQIGAASSTAGITTAQLLAQAGLQVQTAPAAGGQTQMATLVKTVSAPATLGGAPSVTIPVSAISVGLPQVQVKGLTTASVKGTGATPQQLRQFTIQHQALLQQRKAQQQQQSKTGQLAQTVTLGTIKGNVVSAPQQLSTAVGTVQLVQPVGSGTGTGIAGTAVSGTKPGLSTTVTMQQLQQVIRQVTAGNAQVLVSSPSSGANAASGTALLAKAPQGQTVQARVIPVTQQGLKQTIQVVTTGQPGSAGGTTRVATLSASAAGGAMTPGLASALASGTWKVAGGTDAQQKALLSQVSAALQSGQPVSLAVRAGPGVAGGAGARILTTGAAFSTTVTPGTATATTNTPSVAVTTSSTTSSAPAAGIGTASTGATTTTSSSATNSAAAKASETDPPSESS